MSMSDPPERQSSSTPLLAEDEATPIDSTRTYRRYLSLMASPVTGQEAPGSIQAGLLTLLVAGMLLGALAPRNSALHTSWYPVVSAIIGYTYTLSWSVSFYPQVWTNFARRSTTGLSADFCALNVLGFACYSAYNVALYASPAIQETYRQRHHGNQVTVQSNDVAFALHALLLSSVTLSQIVYYDGWHFEHFSKPIGSTIIALLIIIAATPLVVAAIPSLAWLDYLYVLSYIKILITIIKYLPQVLLNYRRKSTYGWSIWQILLDFTGGSLSDLQLVLDCWNLNDWTGLTGNLAKLCLGLVSMLFDTLFMLQHYLWYADATAEAAPDNGENEPEEQQEALL